MVDNWLASRKSAPQRGRSILKMVVARRVTHPATLATTQRDRDCSSAARQRKALRGGRQFKQRAQLKSRVSVAICSLCRLRLPLRAQCAASLSERFAALRAHYPTVNLMY